MNDIRAFECRVTICDAGTENGTGQNQQKNDIVAKRAESRRNDSNALFNVGFIGNVKGCVPAAMFDHLSYPLNRHNFVNRILKRT
jgi:hypothetical protein